MPTSYTQTNNAADMQRSLITSTYGIATDCKSAGSMIHLACASFGTPVWTLALPFYAGSGPKLKLPSKLPCKLLKRLARLPLQAFKGLCLIPHSLSAPLFGQPPCAMSPASAVSVVPEVSPLAAGDAPTALSDVIG